MNPRRTLATTTRVLLQLRHDPRTVTLILGVPIMLILLLKYVFNDQPAIFNQFGGIMLGLFPFTVMFIVTSITTLRERTGGTLERLLVLPTAKLDILLGYALAFGLTAVIQAIAVSWVALGPLDLQIQGNDGVIIGLATLNGLLGMSLGLFVSAFAETEFQAVQFMPAVVMPQYFLCGLFVDRSHMATVLQKIADVLPLTYSIEALKRVTEQTTLDQTFTKDVAVVAAFIVGALVLGAATLRRRTP